MRISIRDVAERAGVSPKTVTNVLRSRTARTSAATRERVQRALDELNYIPVSSASQNRHVETRIIGLVFDNMDAMRTYMGAETYLGLRDGALAHGYDLLTMLQTQPEWARRRPEAVFLDRRCDGYIFVNPENRNPILKALVENEIPTVSCYNLEVPAGVASVTLDNAAAIEAAVRFLAGQGHRRIAQLTGKVGHSDTNQRTAAFRSTMTGLGLAEFAGSAIPGVFDNVASYAEALDEIVRLKATAAVCHASTLAIGLRAAASAHGLRVPEDLSLTGIDDVSDAAHSGITAATFSAAEIGRAATDLWVSLQGGNPAPAPQYVPVKLVDRGSVTPPRTLHAPISLD